MTHILTQIAKMFDRVAPDGLQRTTEEETQNPGISQKLSDLARAERYDELVSAYVAYTSTRIQDERLGSAHILEEQQTSALFGSLASSFWHASVIDDLYAAKVARSLDNRPDLRQRAERKWVYQDRKQESEYGFDFGIVTHIPESEAGRESKKVKITVFQAKRPSAGGNPHAISISHRVRRQSGLDLPAGAAKLRKELSWCRLAIKSHPPRGLAEHNPEYLKKIGDRRRTLAMINGDWRRYKSPSEQRESLQKLRVILVSKELEAAVTDIRQQVEIVEAAIRRDNESLFQKDYSYLQSEALLALAIRGWTQPGSTEGSLDWCHYVQWVNGENGESWSASLRSVLKTDGNNPVPRTAFSETLAAALSPSDRTVGLILSSDDLSSLAPSLLVYSPNLTWGVAAESTTLGYELLEKLCPPGQATAQMQQARGDIDQQQPGQDDLASRAHNMR